MDWDHDERDVAAGHPDRAPRLSDPAWTGMVANVRGIARLARDRHGARAALACAGDTGFNTVAQERDPRNAGGSLADVEASRGSLRGIGFRAGGKHDRR